MRTPGIERRTNFVERNPSPGEIHIRKVATLADASHRDQFPAHGWYAEVLLTAIVAANQVAKRFYPDRSQRDFPTRRRRYISRAPHRGAIDPTLLLQHQVLR